VLVAWLLLAAATDAFRLPMHHRLPQSGRRRASAPAAAMWDRLRRSAPGDTEDMAEEPPSKPKAGGATLLADEDAYNAKIAQAQAENRVVVIKFYASWCRACKAMAPKFSKVSKDWPELEFCEILFDDNKKLCKQLGIKVLPYIEVSAPHTGMARMRHAGMAPPVSIGQARAGCASRGGCS
jgi:thiol-disulfide isomerase/thioredoxin